MQKRKLEITGRKVAVLGYNMYARRLAVDIAEVMADTRTRWLECYNRDFGTVIAKTDLHGKRWYDLVGKSGAAAGRAYLDRADFFAICH
jgi:hypothetical protein